METSEPKRAPLRRRRQQRSVDTRLRIVNAALAEFAKFGFDGASTRGISQAAEVPHSLVIHHFSSKAELWHETVTEAASWYLARLFRLEDDLAGDAASRLRTFCAEYIRFSADHPDFFRMMTQENTLRSERIEWLVEHHVRHLVKRISGLIAEAQAQGRFVEGDPTELLYMFVGAATGPYRSSREIELLTGNSPHEPARVEEHIRACERLFFREPVRKRRASGPKS